MNLKEILIIILIAILVIIPSYLLFSHKESYLNEKSNKLYEGLILFDIDGTLTVNSKEQNYEIVDYCLNKNFAVGVTTAGSIYIWIIF